MTELLLRPLADAFMQVGVFVALMVGPFGWARHRWGHRLDAALVRRRALGLLVAAGLTVPPGCGGAILVVTAYARGGVSYGAAVAALVATTGDASWVLLAHDPLLAVQLKALLLVTGAVTGWTVDALGIEPRRPPRPRVVRTPAPVAPVAPAAAAAGAADGSATALLTATRLPTRVQALGLLPVLLWLVVSGGATVSLPVTFQLAQPDRLYLVLGVLGTLLAVVWFVRGGAGLSADDVPDTGLTEVLRRGGHETAFVTTWVAVAYVGWALLERVAGLDVAALPLHGLAGVAVGTLVGLVPGCALQLVFAGVFTAGGMPVSTLVANSVSQDGDALLPLLALQPRSAVLATGLTTLPALVVGSALLLL